MKKILAVLVMGLYLAACGESLTDAQYLEKAQTNFDRGEVKLAIIEAKNALKLNPDNGQARVLLGKLQLQVGNVSAAEKEFLIAAKLGVPEELFQAELSRALLLRGKRSELQALSPGKLAGTGKADFLANQALAFLSDNDIGQASQLVDEALTIAPDSISALLAKARLHVVKRELEPARALLKQVQSMDANEAAAWSLLGDVERQAGNVDAAAQAFSKAVTLGDNGSYTLLKRAESLIQLKRFEEAQKDVDVLLERSPNNPMVNYAAGQLQVFAKNMDAAQTSFEKVIRVQSDFAPALYPLALIHFQKGNNERAEQYAAKFNYQSPESALGLRLLAMVQYRNQKYSVAEEHLRALLTSDPKDPAALNLLSSTLHRQGKKRESVALLEKMAKEFPDSAYAQLRLGAGLLSSGDIEGAEARMEQAIALNPEFHQADVLLILHHLQQKEFEQALSVAEAYRDKNSESSLPYNLLARAYLGMGQLEQAKSLFVKAAKLSPGDITSNHSLAIFALRDKKIDEARGFYQTILKHHDNNLGALMRLASFDALENKQEPMVSKLGQAMDAHPESLAPRLVMARYLLTQQQPEKVPALFRGLEKSVAKSPDVLVVLATAQLAQKKYSEAKIYLRTLAELKPESARVQYLMARSFAGEKQYAKMQAALEKALLLRPDFFDARFSLASYLINVRPPEARDHIEALKKAAPDNSKVKSMDAILQNKLGDPDKALAVYSKAFKDNPMASNLMLLARQLVYMKNRSEAIALLEGWIEKHPEDVAPRVLLANEYIATNQSSTKSVEQYQAILEQQSENILALNNLAWHLRDSAPAKALGYAQQAIQIKPKSATILDTLAVVQLKNGELEAAQVSIRKALKQAPENPSIRYHSAMIEAAAGEPVAAFERLSALLQEESNFRQRDEALKLLESLK